MNNIYLIFQFSKIQYWLQKTQKYNTESVSKQYKIVTVTDSNMQEILNVKNYT